MSDWAPPKMVCIKWSDAWSSDQYFDPDRSYDGLEAYSAGFLCEENDDGIVLAKIAFPETEDKRRFSFVPWGMIDEWRDIE